MFYNKMSFNSFDVIGIIRDTRNNVLVPFKSELVLEPSQNIWHLVESMMSLSSGITYAAQTIKNRFKPISVGFVAKNDRTILGWVNNFIN